MDFSLIVLSYNTLRFTKACIESVLPFMDSRTELHIVDDGSSDGSREYIKKISETTSSVIAHLNSSNKGISISRNIAMRQAKGRYILCIDNDTIFTGDVCSEMRQTMQANKAHILGMCGILVKNAYSSYTHIHARYLPRQYNVCAVPGYCMMIDSRIVWDDSIYFDERLSPFAGEDVDFCINAKSKGYGVLASPSIPLIHREHGSGLIHEETYNKRMEDHHLEIKRKWEKQYVPEHDTKLAETWDFVNRGSITLSLHTEHIDFNDYIPHV